ncbi:DUF975 family protein [Echinicola pacifica]|nr:hypothetical protein [Echinicola pacifica]
MNRIRLTKLMEQSYDFNVKEVLLTAWDLFKRQPLYSVGYTGFIISLELLFLVYLKEYALLFSIFLAGPLFAGFLIAANKIKQDEDVNYQDFFKGFQYYIPVILIWLISQILVAFGLLLLVIPGVYLMVGYSMGLMMHIFAGLDFWDSMEYSRRLVTVRWWKFFVLILILIGINLLGALLILGIFVTLPVTMYALYVVFEMITHKVLTED